MPRNSTKSIYDYNRSYIPVYTDITERELTEDLTIMYITEKVNIYYTLIMLPIGIVVNVISLLVYSRKKLNKSSIGTLYFLLCIFNIIALVESIIFKILIYLEVDFNKVSVAFCRLFGVVQYTFLQLPSFQQALVSIEIFISVLFPKRFLKLRTKKNCVIFSFLIALGLFILNCQFVMYNLHETSDDQHAFGDDVAMNFFAHFNITFPQNVTHTLDLLDSCKMDHLHDAFADAMNIILRVLIPFMIMLLTSIFVSRKLINSKSNIKKKEIQKRHSIIPNSSDFVLKKEYQFAVTTILLNLFFLIIFLPRSIAYLFSVIYTFKATLQDVKFVLVLNLFRVVSEGVAFINNISLFFTNLAFNNLFRNELFDLIQIVRKKFKSFIIFHLKIKYCICLLGIVYTLCFTDFRFYFSIFEFANFSYTILLDNQI